MITTLSFYFFAVPAVIMTGLGKGGFAGLGILAIPIMAMAVPPLQAAAVLLPILLMQDVVCVWAYRRMFDKRNLAILLGGALIGILLGYVFAAHVSDAAVRLAIGMVSGVFGAYRLVRGDKAKTTAPHVPLGTFWGIVTGFTSFIAHAGGPPFQVYMLPQRPGREIFAGTGAMLFAVINLVKVPPYIQLGQFTRQEVLTALVLAPLAMLSSYAGVVLVRKTNPERFYTLVYLLAIAAGLKLCYDGIAGLVN